MPFAVIDFETTGLVPERTDRVVEVGIVLADDAWRIEDEWTTLVNPRRDLGPVHIHGINACDLLDAPEFADISGHILDLLRGRTVVAHNASFDMRFLHAELLRADYAIPDRPAALCSMKWAGRAIGTAKLAHCCEAFDIPLADAHAALCDARATAQLMPHLMTMCGNTSEWFDDLQRCATYGWPMALRPVSQVAPALRGQATSDPHEWLRAVLQATWIPGNPEGEAGYLLVLENALLDRSISRSEGRQLLDAAKTSGLRSETVDRLHQQYLRSVAIEALHDGVVTEAERRDLELVAAALGFESTDVDHALQWAAAQASELRQSNAFTLHPGDRVVFTGDMARSREQWIATIVAAGLTTGGVTKSTRLVVAADADSLSRKAVQARQYGIPVVSEVAFERMYDDYLRSVSR
ncbi:exonuclease domain-containing protein [Mycolicibacter arupensis]|uniref:exonuclease domain-containing protein n=1 Tax=Mycolicibacter arupensis TaxID=342002 RepID=UPI00122CB1EA|nr:exonuclease domain-containing protein [Mycolicibacter arupensis]KAA1429619.1 DNA polymerase III subunit epsilon [Mycolicibacter arupensis]